MATNAATTVAESSSSPLKQDDPDDFIPMTPPLDSFRVRSYQQEMFESSLRGNIIVAMDTGSGKTHVAIMRIGHEFEADRKGRLIWFLAPTVSLCRQHLVSLEQWFPAARLHCLLGPDGIDSWSEQKTWDLVLDNADLIISTHRILYDALCHGFLRLTRLSLLVFDEAHHCSREHPANLIMRHHYHTIEDITLRPAILGLTASPIVRSKPQELQTLETNLDAVARTPAVHREELEAHVTTPELVPVIYPACPEPTDPNVAKSAITWVVLVSQAVDFHEDPYIKVLLKRSLHDSAAQRSYIKLLKTENTYCQVQFNTFERKAIHLWEELGDWAVQVLVDNARTSVMRKEEAGFAALGMEEDSEKAYLKEHVLRIANGALDAPIDSTLSSLQVGQFSPKLQKLMHLLEQAWTPEFSGLVFVERRITASALSLLLNQHPSTRSRFRSGYAVGESSDPRRKTELGDLTETGQLTATLSAFRAGTKNLLICTNALEEGIDVPACRYVICYDRPANLKSFIQKRGRARARVSTFAIFAPEGESWGLVDGWKDLEREMVKLYQDEGRVVGERSGEDEEREAGYPPLRVEATSAIVTLHTAMAHLHHFCAKLTPEPYVDNRPIFAFEELDSAQAGKFIRAKVTLPASIDALLRITEGRSSWATEKAARKDAAFEAYVKLYRAGLVNDHLLPLRMDRESPYPMAKNTDSILEVCEQKNPWTGLGITGDVNGVDCNWRPLRMTNLETDEVLELRLCTSSEAEIRGVSTVLHWDRSVRYKIEICEESKKCLLSPEHLEELRQTTDLYLRFTHPATPASADSSLPILLSPAIEPEQLGPWLLENSGFRTLDEVVPMRAHRDEDRQVLRHRGGKMGYLTEAVKNEDGSFLVKYILIPKRRDFSVDPAAGGGSTFNDKEEEAASSLQREATIDADEAHRYSIDKLTPSHTRFASLVPSILHTLTHTLLATNLSRTTLAPLNLRNSYPIRQALTSSSAGSSSNYQRLEFLGDSLLKSLAATSLYQTHPSWPESYLSLAKDGLVSNARLTRAALSIGLDAYIITRGFAAQKWRFAELLQDRTDESRMVSAKVLADVVEALIGGAFLEGGLAGAGACVRLFLPELPAAPPPPFPRSMTLPSDSSGLQSAAPTRLLQKLTGYTFKHPGLLLEALTHPSQSLDTQTSSYQRLEFLGDALLDEIVVRKLYEFPEALTHGYLHLAKTAVVNGGFLAYANLALTMVETIPRVEVRSGTRRRDKEVIEGVAEKSIGLWALMRHSNPEIIPAQQEVLERFTTHGPKIRALLDSGQRYPWVELAALDAPKFLSDLVEGLLGAVYMDSNGDMGACEALVERFGVFRVLERAKKGGGVMRLMHPKEELGVLAGEREVRYEGGVKADVAGGGGEGWYWAEVRVGGKRMAGVQGVRGRAEAETRVAALAGDVLRRKREEEFEVGEAEGLGLEVVG